MRPEPDFAKCGLVVVAAGKGVRYGGLKQFDRILEKPLFIYCLESIDEVPFAERVIVLPADGLITHFWEDLQREFPFLKRWKVIAGAEERALSVLNGVGALGDHCTNVVVQDGVRPFPPLIATGKALALLQETPGFAAVVVGSAVTDTIKEVVEGTHRITRTVDRSRLRRAETPQVCRRLELLEALKSPSARDARDEAQALEMIDQATGFMEHDGWNPKITTRDDAFLLECYLRQRRLAPPDATRV